MICKQCGKILTPEEEKEGICFKCLYTGKAKTKICSNCKKELPLSDFYKDKDKYDGYKTICKNCSRDYYKRKYYRDKHKENKYIADEKGILHKIRINKKGEVKVKPRWKDTKTGKAICNGGNTGFQVAVIEDENEETNAGSKITLRKIFVTGDGKPKISKSGKVAFSRGLVLPNDTKICRQICDEIMEIVGGEN